MQQPIVSIILPVYNCQYFLTKALDSVVKQSFSDWELIIIDDGSDIETQNILSSFQSKHINKIKIYRNNTNKGLIYSLNRGIDLCNGKYVARIDCDDEWSPDKLKKQVEFLEQHKEYVMVGTWTKILIFEQENKNPHQAKYITYDEIRKNILKYNFIVHSSIVIRMEIIKEEKYSYKWLHIEDYELWLRLLRKYKVYIIPEKLTMYRFGTHSISYRKAIIQNSNKLKLKFTYWKYFPKDFTTWLYLLVDVKDLIFSIRTKYLPWLFFRKPYGGRHKKS